MMKEKIVNNWVLKLASLAIAVVLWVFVYNITDPVEKRVIKNVPVTFANTEAITNDNKVYEVLDGTDVIRSITISGTRSILDNLDGDVRAEADFSKMKLDNTVEIKIYSDRYNDFITFKPSSTELRLHVEEKVDHNFDLEVEMVGTPKEGYIVGSSKLNINRIGVSGAKSKVANIASAKAVVDVTDTSGDIFSYANIVLYDKEGKEVPRDYVSVSLNTVGTTVEILKTKTVPIVYSSNGTTAEGYVTTGEITSEVNEITIAGKENVVSGVTEIVVNGEELSFENAQENVVVTVDLDDYLPTGVARADKAGNGRTDVTIHVSPIVEKEYNIPMGQIEIKNVPEGYSVVHVYAATEIAVTVRGAEHILNKLNAGEIHGSFDVTAWMEEDNMRSLKHKEVYLVEPVYEMGENLEVLSTGPIEVIAKVLED